MKLTWLGTMVIAGALEAAVLAQQPYPPNGYPADQYGNPQYQTDPGYGPDYDPAYEDPEGVYAPTPPPPPAYAYSRPIAPGPDYIWVDGYWNWVGSRYLWVGGYWGLPPFSGAFWVGPRYVSGRYFLGHWGGYRGSAYRGYAGPRYNDYGGARPMYRAPVAPRYEYRGGGEAYRGGDGYRVNNGYGRDEQFHGNARGGGEPFHGGGGYRGGGEHGGGRHR